VHNQLSDTLLGAALHMSDIVVIGPKKLVGVIRDEKQVVL
jgi:hypothetical protein